MPEFYESILILFIMKFSFDHNVEVIHFFPNIYMYRKKSLSNIYLHFMTWKRKSTLTTIVMLLSSTSVQLRVKICKWQQLNQVKSVTWFVQLRAVILDLHCSTVCSIYLLEFFSWSWNGRQVNFRLCREQFITTFLTF